MENAVIEPGRLIYTKNHVICGLSGLLTGITAGQVVAAYRNIGPAEVNVDSIDMAFFTTTPSSAQTQSLPFGVYKVPGFTAMTNAGARATPPAPVRKRNADHILLPAAANTDPKFETAVQVQVGGVGALTGLTLSPALLADDPIDIFTPRMVPAGTTSLYEGDHRWEPKDWVPLTIGPDEGIVFTSILAFPAALVGRFSFGSEVRLA